MKTDGLNPVCPQCGGVIPADAPRGLCPHCVLANTVRSTDPGQTASGKIPSLDAVAAAFPQLEIVELIGTGGMGAVYKARQPKLDRFIALKVLSPSLAASPAFAERFNREARVLARLNHPGIVSVFDFGVASAQPTTPNSQPIYYLLMEFVDGVNLRQAMQAGRFTPTQALALVPKICEALQFAHDEGILHRDIKPENILLDTKGRVKIADFGIAKLVSEPCPVTKLTATGAAIGTPNYMAPEQLEHPEDVDQRADIYSLGVVFYEMLTGELPIGRFAPPSEKSPVDPRVDAVVFRALEKERERRYRSAGEVKTSVEHLTSAPPTPPASAPVFDPAQDFILCPPQLPRMAKAIIIYALTVAPVLWLLSLFTIEPLPNHPLVGFVQVMANLLTYGLDFLLVILLAIGGWKLRGLRPSAVNWLRTVIWLRIGCGVLTIGTTLWVESLESQFLPDAPVPRPHLSDGLVMAFALAAMVFEISSLVWLHRHRVALRALCTKGQHPSDAPPSYWQQAWLSWPAGPRFGVKVGIIATILGLGWLFAYYRIEWVHEGPYVVRNSVVGWPTPWLSWWRSPTQNSQLDWGLELFTLSFAAGLAAVAMVILFARLRSTERRWGAVLSQPRRTAAPPDTETGPRWSWKSVIGAALVGVSLPVPVLLGTATVLRMGGVGSAEMLILLGLALLLGLPGTILGWMGLSDIREQAGRLRGLPFAVFAALAWPLGLLVGVTAAVPAMIVIPVAAGEGPPLWTRFMLLLPAGVITFAIWAVYATARWGANRPASQRRGVLKWIFLGLVLALGGFLAANRPRGTQPAGPKVASLRPYPNQVQPQPGSTFNGLVEVPAGHLLRVEARLWSNGVAVPVSNLTAHILAPRDRPHRDLLSWRVLSVGDPGNRGAGWNFTLGGGSNPVLYPPPQGAERPDWQVVDLPGNVEIPPGNARSVTMLRGSGRGTDDRSALWEAKLNLRLEPPTARSVANDGSLVGLGPEPQVGGQLLVGSSTPDVVLTVSAPPRENLILSATVLSNRVPVTQRHLRTKLWPPSTSKPTDFRVRWQPVVTAGSSSWDIEVTDPRNGQVLARLCPDNLPQFEWSAATGTPASVKAGHEAREFEIARALRRTADGAVDWSVRFKVQSQPSQPTDSRRGIEADLVVPPNQVALFEVVTRSNGVVVPVPGLAVVQVNAAPEPWTGKFLWADDPDDLDGFTALPRWSFGLIHNGDRLLQTGLGVPVPSAGYTGFLTLYSQLKPDDEVVHGLTETAPDRPAYGLRVRTKTVPQQPGVRQRRTNFGTNWLEEAQLPSSSGTK
ncbi:MAG: serine/threonine protein kinase [Verrucomicrobia bacterium]|nr:serine/threonine protein kinase [Verrucomicrobiota bacterium]